MGRLHYAIRFLQNQVGENSLTRVPRGTLIKNEMTELPPDVQAQIRVVEVLPDDQIDTTDAPEIIDWSDARRGVFYRPVKQQITLRIDADIIAWFKAQAHGRRYQTDINAALREHVQRTSHSD